jgi:hypothetical protein
MSSGWSGAARLAMAAMLIALPASGALAQTSLGGVDSGAPSPPPPSVVPAPAPTPRPSSPRLDYIPTLPDNPNRPPSQTPNPADGELWASIGFTADGSYYSAWKYASKAEAEAQVAKKCAAYGRGACEVSSVSGRECIALSAFSGRGWKLSFTAKGSTFPEAQTNALNYCNSDKRTGGRCTFRTAVCADGR